MTDLRTAAQQALEALEGWDNYGKWVWPESALEQAKRNTTESLTALRAALAEPVQEPVAWMVYTEGGTSAYVTDNPNDLVGAYRALALYTAPPQRPAEPVAYSVGRTLHWHEGKGVNDAQLYLAPPQRKPLSEDEIFKIENDIPDDVIGDRAWTICFARAIERAHGIGGEE